MITQDELKELVFYNEKTGDFTFIKKKRKSGTTEDIQKQSGYKYINILGNKYMSHILAYIYMKGEKPKFRIYHINKIKTDNKWTNLKEISNDIYGVKFGLLTAIKLDHKKGYLKFWLCKCDCGNQTVVNISKLKNSHTKSCGCLKKENKQSITHGLTGSPEYISWANIKRRCNCKESHNYYRYGGRGIKICKSWENSFESFYKDMGKKPFNDAQIDRIDNNDGYSKSNCRWVSRYSNARNKNNSKWWFVNGVRYGSLTEAANKLNVSNTTIFHWCNGRKQDCYSELKYI